MEYVVGLLLLVVGALGIHIYRLNYQKHNIERDLVEGLAKFKDETYEARRRQVDDELAEIAAERRNSLDTYHEYMRKHNKPSDS